MATKHEVDPTTQASMLAPPPASLAVGAVVELEGAYYNHPVASSEAVTASRTPIEAEIAALNWLDEANATKRRITNMSKREYTLENSEGSDPTEIVRLGEAIQGSNKRYAWLRREAKTAFANSIGIETIAERQERTLPGRPEPQEVTVIVAKDPARRNELTERYRDFDTKYGSPKKASLRDKRRLELAR